MRWSEWVLVSTIAVAQFWPVIWGKRLRRGIMTGLCLAVVFFQLFSQGFRWQLIPLYLGALILAVDDLIPAERELAVYPRFRRSFLSLVGLVLMVFLPWVLPIPTFPAPSGPFGVATQTITLTQTEVVENYGSELGVSRRIPVQFWYPAQIPAGSKPLPWTEDYDVIGPALVGRFGLPGFTLDHTRGVSSHSHPVGQPYQGQIPVVIYAHGWTGFRGIASNQLESLASHGYLAIAADHTYISIATVFSDDEVIELDPDALPDMEESETDEFKAAGQVMVSTMTTDLNAIVDALAEGEDGPFGELAGLADLDTLGLWGHSAGGGAAVQWCLSDERCRAVLGMDPWVDPIPNSILAAELQIPSLFMRSDPWRDTENDARLRGLAERSPSSSWWMGIENAHHQDFVLTPIISPYLGWFGVRGDIPADRILSILDDYLVGFFDRHLLGVGGEVFDRPPPPEVWLELVS